MSIKNMTPEEIKYLRETLLVEAILSMNKHRRYWNGVIGSGLALALQELLKNEGYSNIQIREIAPDWEHVYYLPEDSRLVEKIAIKRHLGSDTA
jgi:predicted membrane-bound spermidine synthase